MKKLITLCLALVLGFGVLLAAPPFKRSSGGGTEIPQSKPMVSDIFKTMKRGSAKNLTYVGSMTGKARLADVRSSKAPSKASPNGSTVYGSLYVDMNENYPSGIYEMFLDGTNKLMFEMPLVGNNGGDNAILGLYMREGNFYAFYQETFWGLFVLSEGCMIFDSEGNLLDQKVYSPEQGMFVYSAYDADRDVVYGIYVVGEKACFGTAPGADPTDVTEVCNTGLTSVQAMTYNHTNGKLYLLSKGIIYEVDRNTGDMTEVAELEYPSQYATGMCYSPYDKGYFYIETAEKECSIMLLDDDFVVKERSIIDSGLNYTSLFTPDLYCIEGSAPDAPELISYDFINGSLDGSFTYKLAKQSHAGTPILGDIDWQFFIDDQEYMRGTAAAGSEVRVPVYDLEEGMHHFVFKTSLAGKTGRPVNTDIYIGNDTPKAPAEVYLEETKISWTPVTESVHKGYIDVAAITYNVYLNGKIVAENIKSTECYPQFPDGAEFTKYVAEVEAIYDGKVSIKASSNDIHYGEPMELPLSFRPTYREADQFTMVDANGDGNTIEFAYLTPNGISAQDTPFFVYKYSSDNGADDWLFLPVTNYRDGNGIYEFSVNAFRSIASYPEKMSVQLCTAADPDAVVKELIAEHEVQPCSAVTYDDVLNEMTRAIFTIPSAGRYYIGIHVTSNADEFYLYMRDIRVQQFDGASVKGPDYCTNVQAVAGAAGALTADVSFTMPTSAVDGTVYDATKTLSAIVQAEGCDAVTVEGVAGSDVSVSIPTEQGNNSITINAVDNGVKGKPAYVDVYTGVEAPGRVNNLTATVDETNYVIRMNWEAPTEGNNGGYIESTGITYYFCQYTSQGWQLVGKIGQDVYTFEASLEDGTPQELTQVGIIAENFAGMADYLASTYALLGQPYDVPFFWNFQAKDDVPTPTVVLSNVDVTLGDPAKLYENLGTEDNRVALFTAINTEEVQSASYLIPKFSTKDIERPAVRLEVYGGSTSEFKVYASAYGTEEECVATYADTDFDTTGPQEVSFDLPAKFKGVDWVQLRFEANTSSTESFILYSFRIWDNVDYDFGITAIEGPKNAKIGKENRFTAHVYNMGNKANIMQQAAWKLVDGEGTAISDFNVARGEDVVDAGEGLTFDIAFTPTADEVGNYSLYFNLDNIDDNMRNNEFVKEFKVVNGSAAVVTDLAAENVSYDNVGLKWSPIALPGPYNSELEDITPFVMEDEDDMLGAFKRYDGDKLSVYGPGIPAYGGFPFAFKPGSFMAWSESAMNAVLKFEKDNPFTAKSGDIFLIAYCPSQPEGNIAPADDWLISPELKPGTEFSMSLKPVVYNYGPEIVQIMYSSTNNPKDFQLLEELRVGEGGDPAYVPTWEDYSFTLPEGAKYFALHYISQDALGLMVDDVECDVAKEPVDVVGYDIFRDGLPIAYGEKCADNRYSDATVADASEYSYFIVPLLSDGTKGLKSNTVIVSTTGVDGIVVGNDDAQYYNLQGVRVRGHLEPGIYLRREGNKTKKVVLTK